MSQAFFDSSVLLYTVEKQDPRSEIARALLLSGGFISVQVLNEFTYVSRRKLKLGWLQIDSYLSLIRRLCDPVIPVTIHTHEAALQIAQRYGYTIYDSLMIASAVESSCTTLYSEDMQKGQKIGSVTICNPFKTS